MISIEEIREGNINYQGWKFQAWGAYVKCHEVKDDYEQLGSKKWPQLAHNFYDFVFRVREGDMLTEEETKRVRFLEKSVHLGYEKICVDHPFSARLAYRAIMTEHRYLLDDFEEKFAPTFYWLSTSCLGISSDSNQRVKIEKDGNGDVIVPKIITERYVNSDGTPMKFYDKETQNYITEFPLKVMPWYLNYEKSRVPSTLEGFMEN